MLAAAAHSDSQVLVTFNLDDFPESSVAGFDLAVVHPDDFLLDQIDLHPGKVGRALLRQMNEATRPALTMAELLGMLTRAGVPKFVSEVRRHEFTRPLD